MEIYSDVTSARRAQEALRSREAEMHAVFALIAAATDITESRRAKDARVASHTQLREALGETVAAMGSPRILAVADVVEAMASHRPYRPALGVGAAMDEIGWGSGRLYDEHVVAACQRVVRRGLVDLTGTSV